MKVLKIIGVVVLGLVVIAAIFVMTLPSETHLERKTTIDAPIEKVYAVVNDFGQLKHWSPWFKIDPETQYTYSDNLVGAGAHYSWVSDHPDVGVGEQDLLRSVTNESVVTQMSFGGMEGTYTADFNLTADGDGTELVWTFDGKTDAAGEKIFLYFTESILGPTYDQGLVDLKAYIEGLPDPEPMIEEEMMESDYAEKEVVEEIVE